MTEEIQQETALRKRISELEEEAHAIRQSANMRVMDAELRAEAVRAGMIDLDGLKLLDLNKIELTDDGHVAGGTEVMVQLRIAKPWLFGASSQSSSSSAIAPTSRPAKVRSAVDMTDEEYRAARALIIRRSAL